MKPNDFSSLRAFVEETTAAQVRRCPKCNMELRLIQGRATQQWFWSHTISNGCANNHFGAAIFFPTREEAETATEFFNAPKADQRVRPAKEVAS